MTRPADDRLIVALDFATVDEARAMVKHLGDSVSFYKVGLELLFSEEGVAFVKELKGMGKKVFVDGKFLDIGNTVERAVANAAALEADFVNIHALDIKTMKAGLKGLEGSNTKLLGVTVLTNLDANDLAQQGIQLEPKELVRHRARLANAAGMCGVVASGQEAGFVRADVSAPEAIKVRGADTSTFLIVTPGIRLPTNKVNDQKRITTPEQALGNGATHLVVGRPITQPDDGDHLAAVWAIRESMDAASRA